MKITFSWVLLWGLTSASLAAGSVVISDGPDGSQPASSSNKIITTDGPTHLPYQYPPPIIISNGPSVLPYQSPSPVVVSNGPARLPYNIHHANRVQVSEGPGAVMSSPAAAVPKKIVISDGPTRDTETSALAPVSAFVVKSPAMPAIDQPGAFYVYSDKRSSGNHFAPTGWMGDYRDIRLNESSHNNPHSGETCIQVIYDAKGTQGNGWAGIYWQTPANNWGDSPGGFNLKGKKRLVFWARGEKGGEVISEFKMGGIVGRNSDSASAGTGSVTLKKSWQKYTINLAKLDLSHVIGGFCWSANREDNPKGITFYLDDIHYE